MPVSRRRLLRTGAAALVGTSGAAAGCLGAPPTTETAAGMAPAGDGFLAAGTTRPDPDDPERRGTWAAGLDPDGTVRWQREHPRDRWSGDDQVRTVVPFDDGALLVGHRTREAVVADDALLHAVDGRGRTRWRRTVADAAAAHDAVPTSDGATVVGAGRDGGDGRALWLAGVGRDGGVRWQRTLDGRVPAAATRVDGRPVVVGHATGRDPPWLCVVARDGTLVERWYEASALEGLRLAALVPRAGGATAVATPRHGQVVDEGHALELDPDLDLRERYRLALADDLIRGEGASDGRDPVELVGAAPDGATSRLVVALAEGDWTTLAKFDGSGTRRGERVLQARTTAIGRSPDGGRLLAGSRRVEDGGRDAWLAGIDVGPDGFWTTTVATDG